MYTKVNFREHKFAVENADGKKIELSFGEMVHLVDEYTRLCYRADVIRYLESEVQSDYLVNSLTDDDIDEITSIYADYRTDDESWKDCLETAVSEYLTRYEEE